MPAVARLEFAGGVIGSFAADPGAPGRFLWSVRWPAHRCPGKVKDRKGRLIDCPIPARPQLFRYGSAMGEETARKAIAEAVDLGAPDRGGTAQIVTA